MWVCWYGNDLNKQKSFPSGKNYFASCSFSFFFTFICKQHQCPLPLQVQSHGRRGREEVWPCTSHGVFVVCVKIRPGGARCEAGCPGVALQGHLAPQPRPHPVQEQGQPGRAGRGSCPGAASLLSRGGGDPLSSQVGGGWSFLLESAQWAMDLGRLPWKCIFMKSQTWSAPDWWKYFWKPQLSFKKSLIENNLNFCIIFNNEIFYFIGSQMVWGGKGPLEVI